MAQSNNSWLLVGAIIGTVVCLAVCWWVISRDGKLGWWLFVPAVLISPGPVTVGWIFFSCMALGQCL